MYLFESMYKLQFKAFFQSLCVSIFNQKFAAKYFTPFAK